MGYNINGGSSLISSENIMTDSQDIEKFQNNLSLSSLENDFSTFGKMLNKALSDSLDIHYKFTYEDLMLDAKEKHLSPEVEEKINYMCLLMNEMEFDKSKITKENLMSVSDGLSSLIRMIRDPIKSPIAIREVKKETSPAKAEKNGFFSRLFRQDKKEARNEQKAEIIDINVEKANLNPFSDEMFLPPGMKKEEIEIPVLPEFMPELEEKIIEIKTAPIKLAEKDLLSTVVVEEEKPVLVEVEKEYLPQETKIDIKKIKVIKKEDFKTKKNAKILAQSKNKEPEKILEDLPKFSVATSSYEKKKTGFEKNLGDIVKSLERGKETVASEIILVDAEKKELLKEKDNLKKQHSKKEEKKTILESKAITKEIAGLDKRRAELEGKEKELSEKLKSVNVMEKHLHEWNSKLGKDDESIKKKTAFLESKEKILDMIKKDLDEKYKETAKEIDKIKKDMKEKGNNFLHLQKFYQSRENRLMVEEGNILDEKRNYSKVVSGLLSKHIIIAKKDIEKADLKLSEMARKENKLDGEIRGYKTKFSDLIKEKDSIGKGIAEKKIYFDGVERDFRSKDPEIAELNSNLDKREMTLLKREDGLSRFMLEIENSNGELKRKSDALDMKELDLKYVEKDIEKLNFTLQNGFTMLDLKEKQLVKRISSYEMLDTDIKRHIEREKKNVEKIEEKLALKGYKLDSKIKAAQKDEKVYNEYAKSIRKEGHNLEGDSVYSEFKISHDEFNVDVGNPTTLDILRLLNIAKDFLAHNQTERARDAYLEIQRRFDEIEEEEREDLYNEVMRVFKPRHKGGEEHSHLPSAEMFETKTNRSTNIDTLLTDFMTSIQRKDLQSSNDAYMQIQRIYSQLPKEDKGKYYPKIMDLYNRVLEIQNSGVAV
jgi:hypothetical protein